MGGMRALALVALGWLSVSANALAGDEIKCAEQYTFEEQLILEWAALGGDPHAQFAITQCAYPDNAGELTEAERLYALKWLTVATCDAIGSEDVAERDRLTRKLREDSDLSFRRFGGMTEDEKLNRREKRFRQFRDARFAKLHDRHGALAARVSEAERVKARAELADQFARMGGLGLLRLAEMADCANFGAPATFAAAAWSAAADAWGNSGAREVYGDSGERGWSIAAERDKRLANLSATERRSAEIEKAALLRTDPGAIARLERQAALGQLEQLSFIGAEARVEAPAPSLTTAAQYALEAMGFLTFVKGPDSDYGPSTTEAARKAQAHYGVPPTRWLSHDEVRRLVCDAATEKGDPISYFHLGLMFSEGWSFSKNPARARFAMDRAQTILEARLVDADDLPPWKQAEYPKFRSRIESALLTIEAAESAAPDHIRGEARVDESNLCP